MINFDQISSHQENSVKNKYNFMICDSKKENSSDIFQNKVKKVHFAPSPIICRSIPWLMESNDFQIGNDLDSLFILDQSQYSSESSLKNDFTQLRTPYNKSQQLNLIGFIIIIFCFIFLFSLVWWIAEKLLLIEIEQQMSNSFDGYHKKLKNGF